jgi:hypothetical protein
MAGSRRSTTPKQIVGAFGDAAIWEQWVNLADMVSMDMYWYTLPESSFSYVKDWLVPDR